MIPSNPEAFTCRLPVQSPIPHIHIPMPPSKDKGWNKEVRSHNCNVNSKLDGDLVCKTLGSSQKLSMQTVKSLLRFSWQQSLLTWKHIIQQNPWIKKRDWFLYLLDTRCFSCEENDLSDFSSLFSSVLSSPMSTSWVVTFIWHVISLWSSAWHKLPLH